MTKTPAFNHPSATSSPDTLRTFITRDGSPTLIHQNSTGYEEKMHHSGGALSESLYIYGHAIKLALSGTHPGSPLTIFSVGLGLGYNELILVALTKGQPHNLQIISFEKSDFLRLEFLKWLTGQAPNGDHADEHHQRLSTVADLIDVRLECSPGYTQSALQKLFENSQFEVRSSFPENLTHKDKAQLILYDAYSNKMSAELWDESFLSQFLNDFTKAPCWFVTYAATGALGRALRTAGFTLINRAGFEGKRESTLAVRA